jgi:hypothetical protein
VVRATGSSRKRSDVSNDCVPAWVLVLRLVALHPGCSSIRHLRSPHRTRKKDHSLIGKNNSHVRSVVPFFAKSRLVGLPDIEDRGRFHFSGKRVYQDLRITSGSRANQEAPSFADLVESLVLVVCCIMRIGSTLSLALRIAPLVVAVFIVPFGGTEDIRSVYKYLDLVFFVGAYFSRFVYSKQVVCISNGLLCGLRHFNVSGHRSHYCRGSHGIPVGFRPAELAPCICGHQ